MSLVFLLPASAVPVEVIVKPEKIVVNGREAEVFTTIKPDGTCGIMVNEKDGFHVTVKNELSFPTTIHRHGLTLPNWQDGVPYVTQNPIPPGGSQGYKFPLVQHGTYLMHSHYGLQGKGPHRRAADNAEVVPVKGGESALLRMITGASATNSFVDTGALDAEILAVDGKPVEPLKGNFSAWPGPAH